jgi:hypothetical protein
MTALPMLVNPNTGDVVQALTAENLLHAAGITDPRTATIADLAAFVPDADHLTSLAREAKGIVSDELVRRMDRVGKWTIHEGDLTIKSSSPAAGTERYDDERLAEALEALVQEDLIDGHAAFAAIERVYPPTPEPCWRQKPAGIKALLKLGGRVTEAVLSAMVPVEPPRRSVKVTRTNARGSE